MSHTRGPWKTPAPDMVTCAMGNIAAISRPDKYTGGTQEDNARLIAAAPDLLEMCKLAVGFCVIARQTWPDWAEHPDLALLFAKLVVAISKAENPSKEDVK